MGLCRRCNPFLCGLRDRSPAACWLWMVLSFGASLLVVVACICTTVPVITVFSQPQILADPNPHCTQRPSDYFGYKSITALLNQPICDMLQHLPDAYLTTAKCNAIYNVYDFDTSVASTPPEPPHAPTIYLFIPGHAGHWRQGRWLADELVQLQRATHVFSIDTSSELSAFSGALLLDQIDYVSLVVARLAMLFPSSALTIVGHSYGGVVAVNVPRTMAGYKLDATHIKQIYTLGSPLLHNTAPLIDLVAYQLYSDLKEDYKQNADRWKQTDLYNIAGGFSDVQVELQDTYIDFNTVKQYPNHHQLTTESLRLGTLSHNELTYCQQLLQFIADGGQLKADATQIQTATGSTNSSTSIAIPAGVYRTYYEHAPDPAATKLHYINRLPHKQVLSVTHATELLYESSIFRQVWLTVDHLPQQILSVFCLAIAALFRYRKQLVNNPPASYYVKELGGWVFVIVGLHVFNFIASRGTDWLQSAPAPLEVAVADVALYLTAARLAVILLTWTGLCAALYTYIKSKILLIRRLREYCYSLQPHKVRRVVAITLLSYGSYLIVALVVAPIRRLYLTELLTRSGSYWQAPLGCWLILSVEAPLVTSYNLLLTLGSFYQVLATVSSASTLTSTSHQEVMASLNGNLTSLRALQDIPALLLFLQLGFHCLQLQPASSDQKVRLPWAIHVAYSLAAIVLMVAGTSMVWPIMLMYFVNLTLLPSSFRICMTVLRQHPVRQPLSSSSEPVIEHFAGSAYVPLALDEEDRQTPTSAVTPAYPPD